MMHAAVIFLQRWRYLLLFISLLALLVVQPIASAAGVMKSVFAALLAAVMAILIFALARDRFWRVAA